MNISIKITSKKPKKILGVLAVNGKICLGNYIESIYIPLDWWTLEQYQQQWQEGLERIRTHQQSCLVVTIHDPKIRPYIEWWVLYKEDNKIYIRNELFLSDIYKEYIGTKPFTPETCYDFIRPRSPRILPDGTNIDEWVVTIE
jgi:CdiI N-terminal domain